VNQSKLEPWARELLRAGRVGRLGFVGSDGRPRVLPVTYAEAEGALYSAIDRKPKRRDEPARVRSLRERPEAALTVDRYDEDWSRLAWVQVLGRVVIEAAEDRPGVLEELARKYPQYRREPPPGPLLRLEPERALAWRASGG
jgi:PPOX class probable F420-dependent enzyme